MFGMAPKRRGLFGQPSVMAGVLPGDQPDYRMGDFPGVPQGVPHNLPQTNAAPRKSGFFGQGGPGRAIAGTIGDVLLQRGGLQPIYAPTMQNKQEAQRERAEWQWRKQWERDNPPPVNNDTERDYAFIEQRLGKDAAEQYLRNLGDPMVSMSLPGNRVYSGPRSGLGTALGQGTPDIDAQPTSEDGFDYTPGPGGRGNPTNWKKTGGGAPSGTGTFR